MSDRKRWELIVWFRFNSDEKMAEAIASGVIGNQSLLVMGQTPAGYELRPIGTWVLVDEAGEVIDP